MSELLLLAYESVGVIYGDIGTSLYASVQDKVQNAVFTPIKSVKKIVLLLLAVGPFKSQSAFHF